MAAKNQDLIEAFKKMDTNKDGVLTSQEIAAFLNSQHFNEKFVEEFIARFDGDGDGKVTLKEYCDKLETIPESERHYTVWYGVFQNFDKDGSGFIDAKEMPAVLEWIPKIDNSHSGFDKQALERWLVKYDKDNDGKINYEEFLEFVRSSGK